MSLRKYDPKLLDDITAVAGHLAGEKTFLCEVLSLIQAEARKGRTSGSGTAKHFALKDIETICAGALVRAGVQR